MNSEIFYVFEIYWKALVVSGGVWCLHASLSRVNLRWRVWLWRAGGVSMLAIVLVGLCQPSLGVASVFHLPLPTGLLSRLPAPPIPRQSDTPRSSRLEVNGQGPTGAAPGVAAERQLKLEPKRETATARRPLRSANAAHGASPIVDEPDKPRIAGTATAATPEFAGRIPKPDIMSPWPPAARVSPLQLMAVWLTGCLILLGYSTLASVLLSRRLRQGTQAPDSVQASAKRIAAELGVAPIVVLSHPSIGSPAITGIWRPRMLLPAKLVSADEHDDIRAALTHELLHLRNDDLAWDALLRAVRIVCWPNPFCWPMPAVHRLACERLCDRLAAGQLGQDAYQASLARVALLVTGGRRTPGLAMARTPEIIQRLRFLQRSTPAGPLGLRGIAATVAGILVMGLLSVSALDQPQHPVKQPVSPAKPRVSPVSALASQDQGEVDSVTAARPQPSQPATSPADQSSQSTFDANATSPPIDSRFEGRPLVRQFLTHYNGEPLYGMLPARPDYEPIQQAYTERSWQLTDGRRLRGSMYRVGRKYISLIVDEDDEIDIPLEALAQADRQLVRSFTAAQAEYTAWQALKDRVQRKATLDKKIPELRKKFGNPGRLQVVPSTWKLLRRPIGSSEGLVRVKFELDFTQLVPGKYRFEIGVYGQWTPNVPYSTPRTKRKQATVQFEIGRDLKLVTASNSAWQRMHPAPQQIELKGNTVYVQHDVLVSADTIDCLVHFELQGLRSRRGKPLPAPKNAALMTFEQFLGVRYAILTEN